MSTTRVSNSLRARFWRKLSGMYMARLDVENADVGAVRRRFEKVAGMLRPATGVRVVAGEVGGVAVERHEPVEPAGLLLYLHGGAYVMGSSRTHRNLVSYLASRAGLAAVVPDYRLAPEHRFPAAIDDIVAVWDALLEEGVNPDDVVIAGDSAGGGLAVATLLTLRDSGRPMPARACLLSPWLDLTASGESMQTRDGVDPWFRPTDMPHAAHYYCDDCDRADPRASPVFADVHGLPPTFVQVGDAEILLSDSERLAARLGEAGVAVELDVWPGMWHVFQMFHNLVPEASSALDRLARRARGR